MPCYLKSSEAEKERAIARLEQQLKEKAAKLAKAGNRVTINGWTGDRAGFCDECAVARLRHSADVHIRQMVATVISTGVRQGHRTH